MTPYPNYKKHALEEQIRVSLLRFSMLLAIRLAGAEQPAITNVDTKKGRATAALAMFVDVTMFERRVCAISYQRKT